MGLRWDARRLYPDIITVTTFHRISKPHVQAHAAVTVPSAIVPTITNTEAGGDRQSSQYPAYPRHVGFSLLSSFRIIGANGVERILVAWDDGNQVSWLQCVVQLINVIGWSLTRADHLQRNSDLIH